MPRINRQLDADFVHFLAEKVINVESPMNLAQLCREFKKKNGTSSSDTTLLRRLSSIRNKMSEIDHIDIDTKVKMMFALGSPVSNGVLNELKKQADIELDERNRIINYKKHGNGLQLSGEHIAPGRLNDTEVEKRMMKFLAEKSKNATSPMTDNTFLKEFCLIEGDLKATVNLLRRYNLLKQQIYLTPEFDQKTKIKMMFVSSTKIHASILEEFRQNAVVEVDEYQRITKYKANDGSLNLEGMPRKIGSILKWSKDEEDKLLNFIVERSKETRTSISINFLSREFVQKIGISRTKNAVLSHIKIHLLPKISELNDFDVETRVRMLFALGAPVDQGFLQNLQKEAVVEVDECQRITKYKANDSSLHLETMRHSEEWSKEEKNKLLNFLSETSKKTKVPLTIRYLCREFVEKNEISRTQNSVELQLRTRFIPKIWEMNDIDVESRVKMMFALSVSIEESILNELRKNAVVEIDWKRRIMKYKADDGRLELTRDSNMPSKIKARQSRKISTSDISEVSETNEEIEDDEEEMEESFDKEDDDIINTRTTRNGRLLKNGYPDNEVSCDFDDVTCESFENVKELKNKNTGKATKRSTSQTLKRRKSRNMYFSDTDEESEDEESDEEYEEKEEFEVQSSTRISKRISKQQYQDVDFTCDFDNVPFDSSRKVESSKAVKETEELVEKTLDSSSKVTRVKNQKRKFMENPSDDTSSSLKFKRYENDVTDQNNTESDKIAGGIKKNDDGEVECDDTGKSLFSVQLPVKQESLSYKKVKREDEEYKPDRSFLCGSTQKTMQTLFETEGNLTDNVEQSTENTEEMTSGTEFKKVKIGNKEYKPDISFLSNTTQNKTQNSAGAEGNHTNDVDLSKENTEERTNGKEFMKLLRGLVDSLDSPILIELQSKIEEAIEKLGDGDHNIPIEEIITTLNTGLIILNKNATVEPPTEKTTSLRDFYLILRSTLSTFHSSSLNKFQLKLKETIKKLNSRDKIIPIESIRPVLETLLLLAMP